ncbi:MAG: hypothetical protein AAFV53_10510 [Myxococcota bacterium]
MSERLRPRDIEAMVLAVLRGAVRTSEGAPRAWMSAYQVLALMPEGTSARLIAEGQIIGAVNIVRTALDDLAIRLPIDTSVIDARGLRLAVDGHLVTPGSPAAPVYRLGIR